MIQLSRRVRSMLSLGLNCLALCFSVSAFSTSYWCEGTHKVVKSPCLSVVKKGNCAPNNSNGTVDANETADPHKVQYIWETGEDKYAFQYFHTGFWLSCEEHHGEEKCRSFIELPPESEQGVLWLSVASEFLYIILLSIGFLLMCLDAIYYANFIDGLKINAFAAVITVLSGLLGMVAHMMYMTVFQVAVSLGPKDWRPQTWYYGWSFGLAWLSFTLCMSASVLTLNTYTKTILEFKYRRQIFEKYTASTGSIRGSNSPAFDPDLERFLWEKYIFSVSESLDFSASPPGRLVLSGGRKECSGGYAGLPRSHSGDTKDEDDGEPC
ncbi:germ cell-specific gene 1-like protein [Pseudonaja textilis]|uniref:germ cell-specific gene 1-like protein n=1 Tax=Pseudonaja textilis TaxID=8673 RepID=UPI000EA9ECCF|nr:germ cell-specific gene 1-like protein [Pseudonaja textilis]